jgi:hypothetical protein
LNQTEVPTVETHSSPHWNLPSDSRHEHPLKTKLLDKASGLGSVHMPSPVMSSLLSSRAHRTWNMANLDIVAHHGPVFRIVALMQLGFSCFREGSPISLMVLHRLGFPPGLRNERRPGRLPFPPTSHLRPLQVQIMPHASYTSTCLHCSIL